VSRNTPNQKENASFPGSRMLNVIAGIFVGAVRQVRALPGRCMNFYHGLMQTLAAEESKLRREEVLREIASRKAPD
jgi:hypothetical protein